MFQEAGKLFSVSDCSYFKSLLTRRATMTLMTDCSAQKLHKLTSIFEYLVNENSLSSTTGVTVGSPSPLVAGPFSNNAIGGLWGEGIGVNNLLGSLSSGYAYY